MLKPKVLEAIDAMHSSVWYKWLYLNTCDYEAVRNVAKRCDIPYENLHKYCTTTPTYSVRNEEFPTNRAISLRKSLRVLAMMHTSTTIKVHFLKTGQSFEYVVESATRCLDLKAVMRNIEEIRDSLRNDLNVALTKDVQLKDLASKIDCTEENISQLFRSKGVKPTLSRLLSTAIALGATITFDFKDYQPKSDPLPNIPVKYTVVSKTIYNKGFDRSNLKVSGHHTTVHSYADLVRLLGLKRYIANPPMVIVSRGTRMKEVVISEYRVGYKDVSSKLNIPYFVLQPRFLGKPINFWEAPIAIKHGPAKVTKTFNNIRQLKNWYRKNKSTTHAYYVRKGKTLHCTNYQGVFEYLDLNPLRS